VLGFESITVAVTILVAKDTTIEHIHVLFFGITHPLLGIMLDKPLIR